MKRFIAEYLRIIAYSSIGLVLLITSFYLLINYYHAKQLAEPIFISENDNYYKEYQSKLNEIKNNLSSFSNKNNPNLKEMHSKLTTCYEVLSEAGTFATLKPNNYYKVTDVYNLGSKFKSNALNLCWAIHLSYITTDKAPDEFKKVSLHVNNSIRAITNQVNFATDEIENNSSYFYSTNITSSTIRNYLKADYDIIASSYTEFADIILNLSKDINEKEAGGSKND